jgi:hypothetical protein
MSGGRLVWPPATVDRMRTNGATNRMRMDILRFERTCKDADYATWRSAWRIAMIHVDDVERTTAFYGLLGVATVFEPPEFEPGLSQSRVTPQPRGRS